MKRENHSKTISGRRVLLIAAVCVLGLLQRVAVAQATITVGQGGGYDYATIQAGIDAATTGDTVLVHPGAYVENINFNGKNIVLRSTDPTSPSVVGVTVIDGNSSGSVVTFAGSETSGCILLGFTIRNGRAWGVFPRGGGIRGNGTHACIVNNTVTSNTTEAGDDPFLGDGGGLYDCDGTIQNNAITGNSSRVGGAGLSRCGGTIQGNTITSNSGLGLFGCDGTIQGNTIAYNSNDGLYGCNGAIQGNTIAYNFGGGLCFCDGTIQNNTIRYNWNLGFGGGLSYCDGTIQNNTIIGNRGDDGGGLCFCDGTIQNNAITGNSSRVGGAGLSRCGGTIQGNTITSNSGVGLYECNGTLQNNTIVNNAGRGLDRCVGPIRNCIVWQNSGGDGTQIAYCSTPSYSCIQNWPRAGTGNISDDPQFVSFVAGDFHLQTGSPCIDTGVSFYWFEWPQRDLDGHCRLVGARVDMGCYEYGSSPDSDGDLLADIEEATRGTEPLVTDTDGDGLLDGLEILRGSNPLVVTSPGTFRIPLDVPAIQHALAVAMEGDEIVVLPGTYRGQFQFCGTDVVLRSEFPGNPAAVATTILDGGGIGGPVVSFQGGESEACVLSGFSIQNGDSLGSGGGIHGRRGKATIQYNSIVGNAAFFSGGGLWWCDGTIKNNTISGNSAHWGGGLAYCYGTIQNNTISGNSADFGGGLYNCKGTIRNCIIWENSGPSGAQLLGCNTPSHSCIQDWTGGGESNISADPLFTTGPLGPYYLSQTAAGQAVQSPCVDAGSTTSLELGLNALTTRTDGWPDKGVVDMGCHYPVPWPDLTGTLSEVGPKPLVCGGPIELAGNASNESDLPTTQNMWVEFWAINRQSGSTGYLCDSVPVGPLGAREAFSLSSIASPRAVYGNLPAGLYSIEMRVDATNVVVEWNETNNVSRWGPIVILPDRPNLVVMDFDFTPQDVGPDGGTVIAFSGSVTNTGSQPTTGSFWVEFRVSTQLPFNQTGPYLCDSLGVAQTLGPGETLNIGPLLRSAYALPPGVYYVGIRIDPLDEVAEQNEDDNVTWQPRKKLYVGPRPTRATSWLYYR